MKSNEKDLSVITDHICHFPPSSVCKLLGLVAQALTVAARSTYEADSSGVVDAHKLRAINECQHLVTGILCRCLFNEVIDMPLFISSLEELSTDPRVGSDFRWALEQAFEHVK
jgi:hypothetical protein